MTWTENKRTVSAIKTFASASGNQTHPRCNTLVAAEFAPFDAFLLERLSERVCVTGTKSLPNSPETESQKSDSVSEKKC
jgi:hypothetical protein